MNTLTLPSKPAATTNDSPETLPSKANRTSAELARIKHWCLARADEWYERGEKAIAFEFLKHASEIDPKDAQVLIALGSLHYEQGRFERAGLAFVRAGRVAPENVSVYLHLGLTHQQLGHLNEAESFFHHALRLDPENTLALGLLAQFLTTVNRHADARLYIERALAQQPDDIENLLRLGVCCFRTDDLSAARKCYERVIQLDPAHVLARENLDSLMRFFERNPRT
jgi:cytochrome c-type biogenesis protein CcmH/NrfG